MTVNGKEVRFKSSAAKPRIYRAKFGRDILADLATLEASVAESDKNRSRIPIDNLELFENIAYDTGHSYGWWPWISLDEASGQP